MGLYAAVGLITPLNAVYSFGESKIVCNKPRNLLFCRVVSSITVLYSNTVQFPPPILFEI